MDCCPGSHLNLAVYPRIPTASVVTLLIPVAERGEKKSIWSQPWGIRVAGFTSTSIPFIISDPPADVPVLLPYSGRGPDDSYLPKCPTHVHRSVRLARYYTLADYLSVRHSPSGEKIKRNVANPYPPVAKQLIRSEIALKLAITRPT